MLHPLIAYCICIHSVLSLQLSLVQQPCAWPSVQYCCEQYSLESTIWCILLAMSITSQEMDLSSCFIWCVSRQQSQHLKLVLRSTCSPIQSSFFQPDKVCCMFYASASYCKYSEVRAKNLSHNHILCVLQTAVLFRWRYWSEWLHLQGLQKGLQSIIPVREISAMITDSLRMVDAYIKAFYLPWGDELEKWAMTHPEYSQVSLFSFYLQIAVIVQMRVARKSQAYQVCKPFKPSIRLRGQSFLNIHLLASLYCYHYDITSTHHCCSSWPVNKLC